MAKANAMRVGLITIFSLGAIEIFVHLFDLPHFLLPPPSAVAYALIQNFDWLIQDAAVTSVEILLGLSLATLIGCSLGLGLIFAPRLHPWVWPWLVISQAVPVFALAPLLVLWLGYGMASKIAMTSLIIFFPITASFYDGVRRTETSWLDLARVMAADRPGSRWRILVNIRFPAALPALASGLRIGAGVAPIGAVIGEWVGSSAGLGYAMMQANARLQIDVMFAALTLLSIIGLALFFGTDALLRRLIPWQ